MSAVIRAVPYGYRSRIPWDSFDIDQVRKVGVVQDDSRK